MAADLRDERHRDEQDHLPREVPDRDQALSEDERVQEKHGGRADVDDEGVGDERDLLPQPAAREEVEARGDPAKELLSYSGDGVTMYTHSGTHIDALNHFGLHGKIWNEVGASDDLGVRDRVEVAGEYLAGDQAGEVCHVHHERGADLVGDLTHDPEVHQAGVGGVAGDDHEWTELSGQRPDLVVVQQPGGGGDAACRRGGRPPLRRRGGRVLPRR